MAIHKATQTFNFPQVNEISGAAGGRRGSPAQSKVGQTPAPISDLPAEQQESVRERMEAIGWLAGTVLDAAPGLRAARYGDALEQARALGIPVDNLPSDYHAGLDPQLRQYREQAQSLLGSLGDRKG